jgi:hypothetical protein
LFSIFAERKNYAYPLGDPYLPESPGNHRREKFRAEAEEFHSSVKRLTAHDSCKPTVLITYTFPLFRHGSCITNKRRGESPPSLAGWAASSPRCPQPASSYPLRERAVVCTLKPLVRFEAPRIETKGTPGKILPFSLLHLPKFCAECTSSRHSAQRA